ncbi:hypothetical protein QJS04_geneDACA004189 [Acorus gramineus]|uniref:Uncharacterized protein n=1 Tax=Acorus gramineus TaxID=55184 RepID=A0AAV9BJL0_ACOGR|nr:hypothetical protein QJS04_geneDACA004189 [Acorus gramineus]
MVDWTHAHRLWAKWAPIYCAGGVDGDASGAGSPPLKAAFLINYDPSGPSRLMSVIAEQQGMKAKPAELALFLDFMKRGNYQSEFFFIGPKQYLVTSIHEQWFCARCVNTSEPAGEGVIVMQS